MESTITIEGKQFGRSRALFPAWEMPLAAQESVTLRDLITRVVREEVAAYQERQERRKTVEALTAARIEEAAAKGKIDMGGREVAAPDADEAAAVASALLA